MTTKSVEHAREFPEILSIIRAGRAKAFQAVNVALITYSWLSLDVRTILSRRRPLGI
jgi:hypothetical protein